MHSHRDWLSQKWDVPVQIETLRRHVGDGNSGWEWGTVHGVLVPTSYPDPCLSDQRQIGCDEGLHLRTCLRRPSATVLLQNRLYLTTECLDAPLHTIPAPKVSRFPVKSTPGRGVNSKLAWEQTPIAP